MDHSLRTLITTASVGLIALSLPGQALAGIAKPIAGNPGVNSWFDHTSPNYSNDGNMTRYDGSSWSTSGSCSITTIYNGTPSNCYMGHSGIDFQASTNTDVLAADDGAVQAVYWDSYGGGNVLRLWHPQLGYSTIYAHLTSYVVTSGLVSRGQVIAKSGCTGNCSGPHLHFEVRNAQTGGQVMDPYGWSGAGSDPYGYNQGVLWGAAPTPTPTPNPTPTGSLGIWYMNGVNVSLGADASQVPASGWKAVGAGDMDQDSWRDTLLQNQSTNQISAWMMVGSFVASGTTISPTPSSGWLVSGVADHNQDGSNDIYLQDQSTGRIGLWYMSGLTRLSGTEVDTTPAAGWKMVGTGDFDYDSYPDILLQNQSTGQIGVWFMGGGLTPAGTVVNTTPASGWSVVGTGDFNQDGKADIVLQNQSSGAIGVWYMNGVNVSAGTNVTTTPAAGWKVVGVGDFNQDGSVDIELQLQ